MWRRCWVGTGDRRAAGEPNASEFRSAIPNGTTAKKALHAANSRGHRRRSAVGRLQLARSRCHDQHQPLQPVQPHTHHQRQLAARCRAPQGRTVPRSDARAEVRQQSSGQCGEPRREPHARRAGSQGSIARRTRSPGRPRMQYPIAPQWALVGYAGLGGGGSNFTWQQSGESTMPSRLPRSPSSVIGTSRSTIAATTFYTTWGPAGSMPASACGSRPTE